MWYTVICYEYKYNNEGDLEFSHLSYHLGERDEDGEWVDPFGVCIEDPNELREVRAQRPVKGTLLEIRKCIGEWRKENLHIHNVEYTI